MAAIRFKNRKKMEKLNIPNISIFKELLAGRYSEVKSKVISSSDVEAIITAMGKMITKVNLIDCLIYFCKRRVLFSVTALEKDGKTTVVSPVIKKNRDFEKLEDAE